MVRAIITSRCARLWAWGLRDYGVPSATRGPTGEAITQFPQRQREKWLRWVARRPVKRAEEESRVMWVAHKLSLCEGSSPPLHTVPGEGRRSVGHSRCALLNSGVAVKEGAAFGCLLLCLCTSGQKARFVLFCFTSFVEKYPPKAERSKVIGPWGSRGSTSLRNPWTKSNK